jgi:hypothetical protein
MKSPRLAHLHRHRRLTKTAREQLLAEFDQSGLSGAAFARERRISYATFCYWRQQRSRAQRLAFTEVEIVPQPAAEPLMIELGLHARMRLASAAQVELAAALLQLLQKPC